MPARRAPHAASNRRTGRKRGGRGADGVSPAGDSRYTRPSGHACNDEATLWQTSFALSEDLRRARERAGRVQKLALQAQKHALVHLAIAVESNGGLSRSDVLPRKRMAR